MAAEIAVISVRKTRLTELVESGHVGARAVAQLRGNPERFLATVQIGINVCTSAMSVFGGATIATRIEAVLLQVPLLAPYAHTISLTLVVVGIAYLVLVIGELVPKSLALRYSERLSLFVSPMLLGLASIARPAVWLLTNSSNLILRFFGDSTSFTEARHSREELQQLLDETADAGTVNEQVSQIASRALDFEDLDASDVMVPRSAIRAVPRAASLAEVTALVQRGGHARMPVYDGSVENIVGFINVREALAHGLVTGTLDIGRVLHPVMFVAENMSAPGVLRDLQARRSHMAVVVDEQGSVRGLVTVEDLIEELVGEIFSENDAPNAEIHLDGDGAAVVAGTVPVHEVNRNLGLELPEGENFSTLAGLCIHLAGRIPAQGDQLQTEEGYQIDILDASPRRVRLVRIRKPQPPGNGVEEEDTEES